MISFLHGLEVFGAELLDEGVVGVGIGVGGGGGAGVRVW
jgi:hypothetical protein